MEVTTTREDCCKSRRDQFGNRDADNEELIQTSNEMFHMDKESGTTSILHAMQPKVIPCLFDLRDKKTKIEYLFTFDVDEEKQLIWC